MSDLSAALEVVGARWALLLVERLLDARTFITRNSVYRLEFFEEAPRLPRLRARRQRRPSRRVHLPNEGAAVEPRP